MADLPHRVESRDINNSTPAVISPHVTLFDLVEEVENETVLNPVSPPYRLR